MKRTIAAALAIAGLVSTTAAVAAPKSAPSASRLSIAGSSARVGAPVVRGANRQDDGGGLSPLLGIAAIAAIVGVFLILAEGDDNGVSN